MNPYVDLQPLTELEEFHNPYSDELQGHLIPFGMSDDEWLTP